MFTRDSKTSSRTNEEQIVFALWCMYYKQKEAYNKRVCFRRTTEGKALPVTSKEKAMCNRNAYQNRLLLQQITQAQGIDAYTFNGGKLEARKAYRDNTDEYKQITEKAEDFNIGERIR